jgi:hypothetical protein
MYSKPSLINVPLPCRSEEEEEEEEDGQRISHVWGKELRTQIWKTYI